MSYIGKSTPISVEDTVSKSAGGTFGGDVTVNGTLTATSLSGDGSNLTGVESDLVFDTTPQLGGNLDLNSNDITGTGNINITGTLDLSGTADIGLIEIKSGGGNQMIIENSYHAGIQIRGNWLRFQKPNTNTDMLVAKPDGEVELYYNGSQKLETTDTGIKVTGTIAGASDAEIKTSPIRIHSNTISVSTTVASTENAVSGGPVTIASGVTVTVNGDWTVV